MFAVALLAVQALGFAPARAAATQHETPGTRMLRALAKSEGAPDTPPVVIPGPVVVAADLDLVSLNVTIAGELIVLPSATLSLYGTALRIHNDTTRTNAVATLRNALVNNAELARVADQLVTDDIVVEGSMRILNLARYRGLLPIPTTPDRASTVAADLPGFLPGVGTTRDFGILVWRSASLEVAKSKLLDATISAYDPVLVSVIDESRVQAPGGILIMKGSIHIEDSAIADTPRLSVVGGSAEIHRSQLASTLLGLFDGSAYIPPPPLAVPPLLSYNPGPLPGSRGVIDDSSFIGAGIDSKQSHLASARNTFTRSSIGALDSWVTSAHDSFVDGGIDARYQTRGPFSFEVTDGTFARGGIRAYEVYTNSTELTAFDIARNTITDGSGISLVGYYYSPHWTGSGLLNVYENTIRRGSGISIGSADVMLRSNVVQEASNGISLTNSVTSLTDNVLQNNIVGLSIPYDSKDSIPLMSGNLVNGLSVDGTIRPDEQVYFYAEPSVHVDRRVSNSNHPAFTGALTAQGLITVYDSSNVTIDACDLSQNTFGVVLTSASASISTCNIHDIADTGISSTASSPVITDSTSFAGSYGIRISGADAYRRPEIHRVSAGAGYVGVYVESNSPDLSEITAHGGRYGIEASSAGLDLRNSVATGSFGYYDSAGLRAFNASGHIVGNSFHDNLSGIRLTGSSPEISSNDLASNTYGLYLDNASPAVIANSIRTNTREGVSAHGGSGPRIEQNVIATNGGNGIVADFSSPQVFCNTIRANGGDGIALESFSGGGSQPTANDNNFVDNAGSGIRNGQASTINAERNWWGAPGGPLPAPPGDGVSTFVDYTPWRTASSPCAP